MSGTLLSNVKSRLRISAIAIVEKMIQHVEAAVNSMPSSKPTKLTGRAFYESIGSPKMIVAPMVDRSEFAWRLLTRSYLDDERSKSMLAYTPMLHARLFREQARFRDEHFQPTRESLTSKEKSTAEAWLDGNPQHDRPLFVQFCANKPEDLFEAAQYVAPYCDAVDLNLGCPQGIAKSGHYGAFLQEDWEAIHNMINKLHNELSVPITAKIRVLDTREKTLEYARMILSAGASILTVHGRRREQKGHNMGVADWSMIRYLRDNLPPETVLFANGNILNCGDLEACLEATGADGVMSAEGNLSDPTIFAKPPLSSDNRDYWRGADGMGGFRLDGVLRRYLDIIHQHVLDQEPPKRPPLYIPTESVTTTTTTELDSQSYENEDGAPPAKKRKKEIITMKHSPNLRAMQGHLFQLLRPLLPVHTDIRDALAKCRTGDIPAFERVLSMVEAATRKGLDEEFQKNKSETVEQSETSQKPESEMTASERTIAKYKRPWWVCQPHIRPSPEEAIKLGSLQLSKKEKARLEAEKRDSKLDEAPVGSGDKERSERRNEPPEISNELPKEALVCG